MTTPQSIHDDLDYVASAVRRNRNDAATPVIYYLWAVLVLVGFALPDLKPLWTGPYWVVAGIGGGLASWWLGARAGRSAGIQNAELGRRYGLHWITCGVGFWLAALPMFTGVIDPANGSSLFLLVGGLGYTLAGIHLDRGIVWGGLLMFAAYIALLLFHPPYVWTITGVAIAIALTLAGRLAARASQRA